MGTIRTERAFVWSLIWNLVKLPFTLILFVFGRKTLDDLLRPVNDFFIFFFEARATSALVVLNITLFFVSVTFSEQQWERLLLFPAGLLGGDFLPLLTSGFLHANLAHLLGNILALSIFGRVVERNVGPAKMLFLYFGALLLSGIFTSLIHVFILGDNTPGLGASGAIMGIVAAAILLEPFTLTYTLIFPLPLMVVGWLTLLADVLGVLNPVEDGIGHFAHLAGFFSITLLTFILSAGQKQRLRTGFLINCGCLALVLLVRILV